MTRPIRTSHQPTFARIDRLISGGNPSRWLLAAALAMFADSAVAATYAVGNGTGCTHATIQSAINAAESNPGADTIRVTRSLGYTQQALVVVTAQVLDINGGFATCTQAASDGIFTTLDGSGGSTEPVLRITANTGAQVHLRHLTIRGGDEDGGGYGGGIYFRGNGTLAVDDSTITANLAGYGGGIYAEGTQQDGLLIIGTNVLLVSNTARYSGGGIYLEGIEMDMLSAGSMLAFNKALATGGQGGYGGGLMIVNSAYFASAQIRTNGVGNLGPVYSNEAKYGGGIAVVAADDLDSYADLAIYGPDPLHPTSIRGNFASAAGGAIYARPDIEIGSILVTDHDARVALSNCDLVDNSAADGAAVYLGYDSSILGYAVGAKLSMNVFTPGDACAVGSTCGAIIGNDANDGTQPTSGATIRLRDEAELHINYNSDFQSGGGSGVAMQGNRGGRLIYASEDAKVDLVNVLMAGNEVSAELLRFAGEDDDSRNEISGVTIAGNAIGAAQVITKYADTTLKGAIIWQPGKTTIQDNGGDLDVETVIASEVNSLDAGPEAIVTDPRFVDPVREDYSLRAGSPAVDAAIDTPGADRDVLGNLRDIDLALVDNSRGSRDIGAFERQTLAPLVLNADFDGDTNLWAEVTAGLSSWDGTQNAAGTGGSGAIRVTQAGTANGQRIHGLTQCIHLPGPGLYALNGWGRAGFGGNGNRDYLYLNWEYRRSGGEACNGGAPNASGDHFLSNSSSWQHPVNPKIIEVTPADWTYTSSITITMVVAEVGITSPSATIGWFDGITLEPFIGNIIFQSGFEP